MAEQPDGGTGKSRKRSGGKAAGRSNGNKVKATIHLSVEADQRLNIHCAMMGLDRSTLVEKLINENLKRWVVSDRGGANSAGDAGDDVAA